MKLIVIPTEIVSVNLLLIARAITQVILAGRSMKDGARQLRLRVKRENAAGGGVVALRHLTLGKIQGEKHVMLPSVDAEDALFAKKLARQQLLSLKSGVINIAFGA